MLAFTQFPDMLLSLVVTQANETTVSGQDGNALFFLACQGLPKQRFGALNKTIDSSSGNNIVLSGDRRLYRSKEG